MLTKSQIKALRWIGEFPHHKAGWRRGAKAAYGKPETWDAMRLEGREGSITIKADDWAAILPFKKLSDSPDKMWELNESGLTAIAA